MKREIFLLYVAFIAGCLPDQNLNHYANSLINSSRPGYYSATYISIFQIEHPLFLFKAAIDDIQSRWVYIPDLKGEDIPTRSEQVFKEQSFYGDCEDLSIVYMAVAREIGLNARFCLAKSKLNHSGHIWLEIYVGEIYNVSETLPEKIREAFPDFYLRKEDEVYWLATIPKEDYDSYEPEYFVDNHSEFYPN